MIIAMDEKDTSREETEDERVDRISAHKIPLDKPKNEWNEADWESFSEFYVDEDGYA
jgi:hypothetical protein